MDANKGTRRTRRYRVRRDRLKEWRERRGWSQDDLATRIGVQKQQIWRYENSTNEPSGDVIARLAMELGVSADYLLGLVDQPHGYILEADLANDEREALAAFREYREGNTKRMMTLLADNAPNTVK